MIPLSKQQCGNCRNARPFAFDENFELASLPEGMTMCLHAGYVQGPNRSTASPNLTIAWCSAWELHPDYYEVYGYPSEAEQLEQQRMMAFGPMHIGDPAPPTEFTYD